MNASTVFRRILAATVGLSLLALSGGMAWATAIDLSERRVVPFGVTVAGTDLGGMNADEARRAIEQSVSTPLQRPIEVSVDGRPFTFEPRTAIKVDVDAMVADALNARRKASFAARIRHDIAGSSLQAEVKPRYSIDGNEVRSWLNTIAGKVNREAVDATITVVPDRIIVRPEVPGLRLDESGAVQVLNASLSADAALSGQSREASLPVTSVPAKITRKAFPRTVLVDLSQRRIRLFNGSKLVKTYPCAIGTPSFPTPTGDFEIVLKRYRPTWGNPGSDWAKDMPKTIPPGPGNPLGTRAINLSASGIRFHGTENIGSVGTAASHGCMRMYRSDIEDFYERVEVGDKVFIVP